MSIQDGETTFELSRPLQYSRGGNSQVEATTVTLREPGMEHAKYYLRLRQMLMRCQMEFAKQADEFNGIGEEQKPFHEDADRIEDETAEMIEMFTLMLMSSSSVDVSKFIDTFKAMITLKTARVAICMVDNGQTMTSALWNKLHPDDAYSMAVKWCVFFGMPSAVGGKIISDRQSVSPTELREA